jgi:hypothetical protein
MVCVSVCVCMCVLVCVVLYSVYIYTDHIYAYTDIGHLHTYTPGSAVGVRCIGVHQPVHHLLCMYVCMYVCIKYIGVC